MSENNQPVTPENKEEPVGLIQRLESDFDWNIIGVISIWFFLFATAFLIFQSA
ncbi:MAG: hypothetical protein AB1403_18335 [Candidatus Riflebacteria bacterium]